jgi:hypothetical protein
MGGIDDGARRREPDVKLGCKIVLDSDRAGAYSCH